MRGFADNDFARVALEALHEAKGMPYRPGRWTDAWKAMQKFDGRVQIEYA